MAKFEYFEWLFEFLREKNFRFEWDSGNKGKSFQKHLVGDDEIEAAFNDPDAVALGIQTSPTCDESRFGMLGKSGSILLFVNFTIRHGKIRPISARKANKLEKSLYE